MQWRQCHTVAHGRPVNRTNRTNRATGIIRKGSSSGPRVRRTHTDNRTNRTNPIKPTNDDDDDAFITNEDQIQLDAPTRTRQRTCLSAEGRGCYPDQYQINKNVTYPAWSYAVEFGRFLSASISALPWNQNASNGTNSNSSNGPFRVACAFLKTPLVPGESSGGNAVGVVVGSLCCLALIAAAIVWYRRNGGVISVNRHKQMPKNSMYTFANETYSASGGTSTHLGSQMTLDRKTITLGKVIGEGNFGKVYLGTAKDPLRGGAIIKVAIKSPSTDALADFEAEMEIMGQLTQLGGHANIVSVVGCVYGDEPLLVLEFCGGGSLKSALTEVRKNKSSLPVLELTKYGHQVALAMKFLEDNLLLHRDLAARNILLTKDSVCKLSDFGLSRNVGTSDYYRRDGSTSAPIPVRWMAPETLDDNVSTIMSDRWSFAVLLYEIYSMALRPYTGLSNHEIAGHIRAGRRLEQPKLCPNLVYATMLQCWSTNPQHRPAFADLAISMHRALGGVASAPKTINTGIVQGVVYDDPNVSSLFFPTPTAKVQLRSNARHSSRRAADTGDLTNVSTA